jgi:DsbC/DsbD-like thiol-disulfide interchange protein
MMLLSRRRIVQLAALATLFFAWFSYAQSPATPHLQVELISEQAASAPGQPLWVGLWFRLEPGWHIYWQNPGDSGEPPKVQWELPTGFTAGPIRWPQPIRLGSGSIIDYGYEGQVLLMAPIVGPSSGKATSVPHLAATVKYIVCREVCIPGKVYLMLSSPPAADWAPWRTIFQQTRAEIPKPTPANWRVTAASGKQHFILSVRATPQGSRASFFPLEPNQVDNSSPQDFASSPSGFRLTLKKSDQLMEPITNLRGVLVLGPGRAFEISAPMVKQ